MTKNSDRNQQGFAHILLLVLVVVVLGVAGFAGWRIYKNNKDKSPADSATTAATKTAAKSAQSTCEATHHDKDFCKFEAAMIAQPIDKIAFTAVLTATQDGTPSTMQFSQDSKGNTSLVAGELRSISYNGSTYVKMSGDTWTKYPASASTPTTTTNPTSDLAFANSLATTKFSKIGTEACGKLTCIKYKISDSTITAGTTQYVWFDTDSYKLREWSSTDSTGTTDMKITYEAVTITAPSPVQEFSPNAFQ